MGDLNVEAIIRKLRGRSTQGEKEYGVTTDRADLTTLEWLLHLQEELLDASVYIEQLSKSLKDQANGIITVSLGIEELIPACD